jgi:protein involved in polysaccharide export with SLBB domain
MTPLAGCLLVIGCGSNHQTTRANFSAVTAVHEKICPDPNSLAVANWTLADSGDRIRVGDSVVLEISDLLTVGEPYVQYSQPDADGNISIPFIGFLRFQGRTADEAVALVKEQWSGREVRIQVSCDIWVPSASPVPPRALPPWLDNRGQDCIHVGDRVSIHISEKDREDRTEVVTVNSDGEVIFPLTGPIRIGGLNEASAAYAIRLAHHWRDWRKLVVTVKDETARIHVGDRVLIEVGRGWPTRIDPVYPLTVDSEGRVSLPRMEPVKISDLTESEASSAVLQNCYREITTPISVSVKRQVSRPPGTAR